MHNCTAPRYSRRWKPDCSAAVATNATFDAEDGHRTHARCTAERQRTRQQRKGDRCAELRSGLRKRRRLEPGVVFSAARWNFRIVAFVCPVSSGLTRSSSVPLSAVPVLPPLRCVSPDTDLRFGRHESFLSYESCRNTQRNKGLFTASQDLQGNSQQFTRQNPGQRNDAADSTHKRTERGRGEMDAEHMSSRTVMMCCLLCDVQVAPVAAMNGQQQPSQRPPSLPFTAFLCARWLRG